MKIILNSIGMLVLVCTLLNGCTPNEKEENGVKYGSEYLADSIYHGDFKIYQPDSDDEDDQEFAYRLLGASKKYYNHMLYCFDTIKDQRAFGCSVEALFYGSFPVEWGILDHKEVYFDCANVEGQAPKLLNDQQFKIYKYNSIHGASVIVNSCLFNKYIPKEKDKKYLNKKYFEPNSYHRYISDFQFEEMRHDIEKMCKRLEDYY